VLELSNTLHLPFHMNQIAEEQSQLEQVSYNGFIKGLYKHEHDLPSITDRMDRADYANNIAKLSQAESHI